MHLLEALTMSKKPRLVRGKPEVPVTQSQQVRAWLRYRNSPNALFLYLTTFMLCTLCLNSICNASQWKQVCTTMFMIPKKIHFLLAFGHVNTLYGQMKTFLYVLSTASTKMHLNTKWSLFEDLLHQPSTSVSVSVRQMHGMITVLFSIDGAMWYDMVSYRMRWYGVVRDGIL